MQIRFHASAGEVVRVVGDSTGGDTTSPPALVTNTSATTYQPGSLKGDTVYVWRIVAKNAAGSTFSDIWSFSTVASSPAVMTTPAPGSTLAGAAVTFQWTTGTGVTEYYLYVSKVAVDGNELYSQDQGTNTSVNITNLPTDGSTIYVRLYSKINAVWSSIDYTYKTL